MPKLDLNNIVTFSSNELNYFKLEFDFEVSAFSTYINENSKLIESIQNNLKQKIAEDKNLGDPNWEYLNSYYSHHYEFGERVNTSLMKTYRFSTLLSIMEALQNNDKQAINAWKTFLQSK